MAAWQRLNAFCVWDAEGRAHSRRCGGATHRIESPFNIRRAYRDDAYTLAAVLLIGLIHPLSAAEPAPTPKQVREAIVQALPLLRKAGRPHGAADLLRLP